MIKISYFYFIFLLFTSFYLSAQDYVHQLKSFESNIIKKVIVDDNSNVISAGSFQDSATFKGQVFKSLANSDYTESKHTYDIFVTKSNPAGNIIWTKIFGGEHYNYLIDMVKDKKDFVFLAQFFYRFSTGQDTIYGLGDWDGAVVKIDSSGHKIWAKSISSKGRITPRSITTDDNSNTYVIADCRDTFYIEGKEYHQNFMSSIIVKFNPEGVVQWVKILRNEAANYYVFVTSVSVLPDGGILIAGNASRNSAYIDNIEILGDDNTNSRFFLIKIKEDNTIIWKNIAVGIGPGIHNKCITVSQQGDIYTSGQIFAKMQFENHTAEVFDANVAISDVNLNKYTSEGKLTWMKVYGTKSDNDFTNALKFNNRNNKIYFTSSFKSGYIFGDTVLNTTGNTDAFLSELDTSGELIKLIATRGENGLCFSSFQDFDLDIIGNFYIAGTLNFMLHLGDIMLTTTSNTDAFLWKVSNWV